MHAVPALLRAWLASLVTEAPGAACYNVLVYMGSLRVVLLLRAREGPRNAVATGLVLSATGA
jgi:hypothetical protein